MPETSAKNKQLLKRLLAEPGNKHCADCKTTTHPRWASWNIGVFLCIRCSGVHRSLGTHISKVRSVDLDSWSDVQLVELERWGNTRANQYWESGLPPNYIPDEGKIVNFIRTKYDLKRWAGKAEQNPRPAAPVATAGEDVPLQQVKDSIKKPAQANLLDFDDFESAPPVPGKTAAAATTTTTTTSSADLFASSAPSTRAPAGSSATRAPAPARYGQRSQESTPTFASKAPVGSSRTSAPAPAAAPAAAPATPTAAPRADLKKSILSLYAQKPQPVARPPGPTAATQPSAAAHTTAMPATSSAAPSAFDFDLFAQPKTQASRAPAPSNTASLIDSFGGLSFGNSGASPATTTTPAPMTSAAPVAAHPQAPASYAAPMTSTAVPTAAPAAAPATSSTFAPVEEDDFFSNPWK